MANKILIVAAHPDDEVLGCGGAIAKHSKSGDNVTVLFLTDGVSSRGEASENMESDQLKRKEAAVMALSILGVTDIIFKDFPDNSLDSIPLIDVIRAIEKVGKEVNPEIIYSHSSTDLNIDHRIAAKAVKTAFRPIQSCPVRKILSFEILSSTNWSFNSVAVFRPQIYIDISDVWEKKIAALECYEMEMRQSPHARSFRSISASATLHGETIGYEYAEAFELVWERS